MKQKQTNKQDVIISTVLTSLEVLEVFVFTDANLTGDIFWQGVNKDDS